MKSLAETAGAAGCRPQERTDRNQRPAPRDYRAHVESDGSDRHTLIRTVAPTRVAETRTP